LGFFGFRAFSQDFAANNGGNIRQSFLSGLGIGVHREIKGRMPCQNHTPAPRAINGQLDAVFVENKLDYPK